MFVCRVHKIHQWSRRDYVVCLQGSQDQEFCVRYRVQSKKAKIWCICWYLNIQKQFDVCTVSELIQNPKIKMDPVCLYLWADVKSPAKRQSKQLNVSAKSKWWKKVETLTAHLWKLTKNHQLFDKTTKEKNHAFDILAICVHGVAMVHTLSENATPKMGFIGHRHSKLTDLRKDDGALALFFRQGIEEGLTTIWVP